MMRSAEFSGDRRYRFELRRAWEPNTRYCAFIGLNPSTADERQDDPTVRRCINFAASWGYGGLIMLNLFAFRATDPKEMMAAIEPVGEVNDEFIEAAVREAALTVAAWGVHGAYRSRGDEVRARFPHLKALGLTKSGEPLHPLYVRGDAEPVWL